MPQFFLKQECDLCCKYHGCLSRQACKGVDAKTGGAELRSSFLCRVYCVVAGFETHRDYTAAYVRNNPRLTRTMLLVTNGLMQKLS